jgi:hypothetical protein
VFKAVLDSGELAFLVRQLDEYIQVMEFMIRKTPALDNNELASASNLQTKLSVGKRAEPGQKNITKKSG